MTSSTSGEPLIVFKDVRIGFDDGEILRGVSFNVAPGETFDMQINGRLMRPVPLQAAVGPLVRVIVDGILFKNYEFYGPDRLNSHRQMLAWAMQADRLQHDRSDGDVGNETAIHHVDMDPVGAGGVDGANLFTQARKIGRQNGGRDYDRGHPFALTDTLDFECGSAS